VSLVNNPPGRLSKQLSSLQGATAQISAQTANATDREDQMRRKTWAETVLAQHGIPVNTRLPCIESEADVIPRSIQDISDRLLALTIVSVKGEGLTQDHVLAFIKARNVQSLFSPKEQVFIDNPEPSAHDCVQFCWRYEAAWVMFWALNFIDGPLSVPDQICDVPRLVQAVRDTKILSANGCRATQPLLDEADLVYRYHWAIRQASIDGKSPPGGLDPGVVRERHHALNWLIGYDSSAAWDDVGTDT
jgi:hypothetical protein